MGSNDDTSDDQLNQILQTIQAAVHEYGEVHSAEGMDESEQQPTLHQHSKHIYNLSNEYLSYDPNHLGVRKLYKWFGQTIRGQFPGHCNMDPEQHKPYDRVAVGDNDDMPDMDPSLCDDSEDEGERHGNEIEDHDGWDGGKDGQEHENYDHDNWNDDGQRGQHGQDDQNGHDSHDGQDVEDDYDGATDSDNGGDQHQGHHEGSHYGQHHDQVEDDY
ncbi:hypothetical protein EDD37DRAFT_298228 [Exophiala viscosa]|uniref:Uncharacterized protein n=1 Tax=Exophiala viscosa TaxID=2486360 RepID=A0AAN6IJ31_9EURO|nr:hypothetical protein EDD36DRAFT_49145 [Exophiala viscosa]KAI1628190.1 hypothetical protein EDD37DRAFT_298228 [Exophiala viscosa]